MGVFCNKKNLLFYSVITSLFTLCLVQKGYCSIRAILRYTEQQKESREPVTEINSEKQQTQSRMFANTRIGFGNNQEDSTTTSNNIDDDNMIKIDNIIPDTEINIEKIIETGVRTTENNTYTNTKSRKFTTSKNNQENDNNTDETDTNSKTNDSYYFSQQNINFNNCTFNIGLNDKDNGMVEYFGPSTENTRLTNTILYKIQKDVNYILENLTKITNDLKETKKENIFLKQNNKLLVEQNRLLKEQNENNNGFGFNFNTIIVCINTAFTIYLGVNNLFFMERRIKAIVNSIIDKKLQLIIVNGINGVRDNVNVIQNGFIEMQENIVKEIQNGFDELKSSIVLLAASSVSEIKGTSEKLLKYTCDSLLSTMKGMINFIKNYFESANKK